ncbi:molybdenum ABC transporter ATP-binding protein [Roseovarius salinarum]|uniref:molybdenum ABC transporter ATP-binding protein n=1 Tax=Roseovarius salinarum TaxID=1981892 RepID=UPI000C31F8D2|nr:molybdenum ABC transporter ATP-binding protein [Roseovarius salinarum]
MSTLSLDITLERPDFALSVTHAFPAAGLTAVFGPSGSGKTTLLRVIAGFEPGARGTVRFDGALWQGPGRFVPPHRRGVGYVFQEPRLFPHLSVSGNLAYAERRARRAGRRPDRARVEDGLDLGPLRDRRPAQLSGGEAQRVAMARALLTDPKLMLMDEPLSALDAARKDAILPYIEAIRDRLGVPILFVSHSVPEVARLADTVVLLKAGQVAGQGSAEEVLSDPALAPSFGVREVGSILTARVTVQHDDGLTEMALPDGQTLFLPRVAAAPGQPIRARIAAHDVILSRDRPEGLSALNVLRGTIAELRRGPGPGVIVRLRVGDADLLARVTRRSADALGLREGLACHAVAKTVSVAAADIGLGTASLSP